ncbi:MAG: sigma-70 family RNA polymerase sigma factor [Bryobacterales bacterium]|nr:sigma-70 family RNA polymerase sigma factor [Bryobacterales bacterium]
MELEPALQTLADSHRRFLAFLEPRVESRAVAEDILQSAFVRAVEHRDELADQENVVAWFYRVLRNAVVDHYRQKASRDRRHQPLPADTLLADTPNPATQAAICDCFLNLLHDLKPEYREALEFVDLNGGSLNDLAAQSGITANNAAVRIHRARQALRKQVVRACGTCAEHGCFDCHCGSRPAKPGDAPHACSQ